MKHGWEYKKFTDVCDVQYGFAFDSKFFTDDENAMPLIRIRDVMRGYSETFYNGEIPNGYLINEGDYLVGMDGEFNIGRWGKRPGLLNQRVCKMSSSSKLLDNQYMYYFMKVCLKSIEDETPFVTVKHLSAKRINLIEIPLPPLLTQQSIASELDKINELIRLKKDQLKDYDNLAQSIFYEMFGDPIENEKGWEVKKLGDVCEVSSFKRVLVEDVLEKGPVPFIRGTELSAICKENKREYKMYITMEHYERVKNISGVPNVGDLLIPSINAEGLVWVVDTPEPMYYKDGRVLWVHVDQNSISSIALQRILNNLIKDNYSKITNGAVFAELNLSILRSFPIILPPLSIQNAFANKINLIEKQKAEIQTTIADLETLLASRMQYWFD